MKGAKFEDHEETESLGPDRGCCCCQWGTRLAQRVARGLRRRRRGVIRHCPWRRGKGGGGGGGGGSAAGTLATGGGNEGAARPGFRSTPGAPFCA
ncbi:unnamed protein product [Lampetra fluviatilis]